MRCQAVVSKALRFNAIHTPRKLFKKSFAPAWALKLKPPPLPQDIVPSREALKEDFWSFGKLWCEVVRKYSTVEALYTALANRQKTTLKTKEAARSWIQAMRRTSPLYQTLSTCSAFSTDGGTFLIDPSRLIPIEDGTCGSYFLKDASGQIRFVVKPIDEDIGCINNPKGYATPFKSSPVRQNISLYSSSFREAAACQFAQTAGISQIAPKTILAILQSDAFHDLSDTVSPTEIVRYREHCGAPDREKLCSVQEFIPNAKTLGEALQEFQAAGLLNEEIAARLDQTDFEDANLLLWLTNDTDGHAGNFLVYVKSIDAIGNEILGLKKIDNGLTFPEENHQLRNHLAYLPNAKAPLSASLKAKIAALDPSRLEEILRYYQLGKSAPALKTRIAHLQQLAQEPNITLQEINRQLS